MMQPERDVEAEAIQVLRQNKLIPVLRNNGQVAVYGSNGKKSGVLKVVGLEVSIEKEETTS